MNAPPPVTQRAASAVRAPRSEAIRQVVDQGAVDRLIGRAQGRDRRKRVEQVVRAKIDLEVLVDLVGDIQIDDRRGGDGMPLPGRCNR